MENSVYHKLSNLLWGVIVILLVLLAVYVSVGRLVMSNIGDYRTAIIQELNLRVPFEIEAARVSGELQAFTPTIVLSDLRIRLPESELAPLKLSSGRIGVDVLDSMRTGSLQVTQLVLDDLTLKGSLSPEGRFSLPGFGGGGGEAGAWLREFLLNVELVSLRRNVLRLKMPGGETRDLDLDLLLTRSGSQRELDARLTSTRGMGITLLGSGLGDPFQPGQFSGDLYVDIDTGDLGAVRDMLADSAMPAWSSGQLALQLWLSWRNGDPAIEGRLDARQLEIMPREGDWRVPLDALSLTARLERSRDHWTILAEDVAAENAAGSIELPRLQLDAWDTAARLRAADVDLAPLAAFVTGFEALPDTARSVIAGLEPAGRVDSLQLSLGDLRQPTRDWELELRVEGAAVTSYRGAPGATGVRGYAQLGPGGGTALVDSSNVSLDMPTVYREPLRFNDLFGSLDIRWDERAVTLESGLVTARGEEGTARALFGLDIPLGPSETGPDMTLLVGLRDTFPRYRSKFIPYRLDPALLDWLSSSIGEGRIEEGAFLWRGSLRGDAGQLRTVQLAFNLADTALAYHPDWPPVTIDSGVMLLDDSRISVWADSARVIGSSARDVSVETWVGQEGRVNLAVRGGVAGPAADGMAILNETPLRPLVGGAFEGWQVTGDLEAQLDLLLELGGDAPPLVDVQTYWRDVDLTIAPGDLPLEAVNGSLRYSSREGFSAENLVGTLWGRKVEATLLQRHAADVYHPSTTVLDIRLATAVDTRDLRDWLQLATLAFGSGAATADVGLRIAPGAAPVLTVDSDLRGISLDLPEPWGKDADSAAALRVEIPLARGGSRLDVSIDEQLNLSLDIGDGGLRGGALGIGEPARAPRPGVFHVSGEAAAVDAQQWIDFVTRYLLDGSLVAWTAEPAATALTDAPAVLPGKRAGEPGGVPLRVRVDRLRAGELTLLGQRFESVELGLDLTGSAWLLALETDWLRAVATNGEGDAAARIEADYLDLDRLLALELDLAEQAGEALPDVPPVQVDVANLQQGERRLGELAFRLAVADGELTATDVRGALARLRLDGEQPGSLAWQQGEPGRTVLRAPLAFDDIGESLAYFGYERILKTDSGRLDVVLEWPGNPARFALADARGSLGVDIGSGNFLNAPAGATGALRVVSILNLVDIVQRLSLSQPFESGIPFDEVTGEVFLHAGTIEVPRVDIRGGSSFHFSGVSDVEAQSLNGELVATLPVAKNLPWVAALAAGLPVAAGVFLVSQVFDEQFNRLSSAVYTIEGSWDEPQVSFDRMFDNTTEPTQARNSAPPQEASPPATAVP